MNAVAKLQEQEARRGKGVTREAQELFDAFSRTTPARWDGTSIVVADAVVIAKPYRVDDCRSLAAGDSAALTRVRKVVSSVNICSFVSYSKVSHLFLFPNPSFIGCLQLEMERKKIELRNSSATIGNSNSFSRQTAAISTNAGVKDRVAVPNHLDATVVGQRKGG
jgi:protein LSM12